METDGDIGFESQTECKFNELGAVGVALFETERPQYDGQTGLLVAHGPDPLFDVLNVVAERRLARHEWFLHPAAQSGGDLRIGTEVGEDLECKIPGLLLRPR